MAFAAAPGFTRWAMQQGVRGRACWLMRRAPCHQNRAPLVGGSGLKRFIFKGKKLPAALSSSF